MPTSLEIRGALVVAFMATTTAAMAGLPSWDYRVELKKDTGGLAIAMHASNGPAVNVGLENKSGKTVHCTAGFTNYPHEASGDEKRSVTIASGKRATLAYPARNFGTEFSTAYVNVKCR